MSRGSAIVAMRVIARRSCPITITTCGAATVGYVNVLLRNSQSSKRSNAVRFVHLGPFLFIVIEAPHSRCSPEIRTLHESFFQLELSANRDYYCQGFRPTTDGVPSSRTNHMNPEVGLQLIDELISALGASNRNTSPLRIVPCLN